MLIVFEAKNIQEDYAKCFEFIKILEDMSIRTDERERKLMEIIDDSQSFIVKINQKPKNVAYNYLEQNMIFNGKEEAPDVENAVKIDESTIKTLLYNEQYYSIHYHMRIKVLKDDDDIINLQYLALLIIALNERGFFDKKIKKKFTAFLIPFSETKFPYKNDNDLYIRASTYLRLMAKKFNGVVYGVDVKKNESTVSAINFRHNIRYGAYLPLILIDSDIYPELFSEPVSKEDFDTLFKMKKRQRFGKSRDENPNIARRDFLLEASFCHLSETLDQEIYEKQMVKDYLLKKSSLSVMELCLFAYLLSYDLKNYNKEEEKYAGVLNIAQEICEGLRQIVQNSLQYSKGKNCLLSFCLHQNRESEGKRKFEERLSLNYPKFAIDPNYKSETYNALEIYVTDYNDQEDIIDSFSHILQEEKNNIENQSNYSGHNSLISNKEKIAVRNFFGEFEENDLKKEWIMFRKEDIVAHIGLALFKRNASKCKAALKYVSSKTVRSNGEKNHYYCSFCNELNSSSGNEGFPYENMRYVIPGTQLSLLVPVQYVALHENQSQGLLYGNSKISEDYDCFASFLDYKEEHIMHNREIKTKIDLFSDTQIYIDAKKKSFTVSSWKKFWMNKLNEDLLEEEGERVFNHDFKNISGDNLLRKKDNVEVCLKGLLWAVCDLDFHSKKKYVAITNAPKDSVSILCGICITVSACSFPENLQLYVCEQDHNKKVVILGKSFLQVVRNAYQLSLEHGYGEFTQHDYEEAEEIEKITTNGNIDDDIDKGTIQKVFPFDCLLTNDENATFFEEKIKNMVNHDMESETSGYMINGTHMRLGSKVHTESFYEMSFLFYRTSVANQIAYIILRHLMTEKKESVKIKEDNILFYGYASYSKAILTSLVEILKLYRKKKNKSENVAFASYQHNYQSLSDTVQLQYLISSKRFFPGEINKDSKLELKENIKLIQIVPISTMLTTFSKMYDMFVKNIKGIENVNLVANYTFFWICDENQDCANGRPSEIEKRYWKSYSKKKRCIETILEALIEANEKNIFFFIQEFIKCHNPIFCNCCYPTKRSKEIPLVETDVTSTVPTQQIRKYQKKNMIDKEWISINSKRILELQNCVYYGHIYRRQNHYQYYIDTQRFFIV